jgi:hypothetical protein
MSMRPLSLSKITATLAALAVAGTFVPSATAATLLDDQPKVFNFELDDAMTARIPLLAPFHDAAIERPGPMRTYLSGTWGRWGQSTWWSLSWAPAEELQPTPRPQPEEPLFSKASVDHLWGFAPHAAASEQALQIRPNDATWAFPGSSLGLASTGVSLKSNGFDALWFLKPLKPKPDWRCRRRPVQFVRYGGESDRFDLVHCDGSVAPEALDRLTLMARLPEVPRPGALLPEEPDAESIKLGEWLPGVRVANPRLLWALQRISDAFPWRTIYVFSGYRQKKPTDKPGSHHSMHSDARAMDIYVMGIHNADLFKFCRSLDDVGCGYYPNSKFVHVDVRKPGTGHAFWVDISGPGEPAHYVDSWPGVVDKGALVWDAKNAGATEHAAADASCTTK